MVKVIILILIITSSETQLNPKGPTHEKYALNCLETLITKQFHSKDKLENNQVELLTVLVSENMTTPAFEIQQKLIRNINNLEKFTIEVIQTERNHFKTEIYTKYCLIIVDSLEKFDEKKQVYLHLTTREPEAFFLIYYTRIEINHKATAAYILGGLWDHFMNNALVLLPKSLRRFYLYTMEFDMKPNQNCLKTSTLKHTDTCTNGIISTNKSYYRKKRNREFSNCTLDVIAKKIDPFVITTDEGFEIEFLKEIGLYLNVSFNITLSDDDSWGVQENGFWTNGLGQVYNYSALGIGNFYMVPKYTEDFEYSTTYFYSSLVFIVPIADYVPKWRVLIAIFNWYLWLLCIASIFICALLFWFLSLRSKVELQSYKYFGYNFLVSIQVMINYSVFRQPKSDWTRIIFVSFAIFAIIISSVYTSSLIQFLTHPQRERQIDTIDGVIQTGWDIGGLPVHEDIFHVAQDSDEKSRKIHEIFQVNESLTIWLQSVADDRDTCTIISDFFIKYMLAKQDPSITDSRNKSKVFILNEKIYSYGLSIVANRGFLFMERIDWVIGWMNAFGLVNAQVNKYTWFLSRVKSMQHEGSVTQALDLTHLQSAFAVVILGEFLGILVFLGEILVFFIKKRKRINKKKLIKRRKRKVENKNINQVKNKKHLDLS